MVLGTLESHMQKNKIGPLSYAIQKIISKEMGERGGVQKIKRKTPYMSRWWTAYLVSQSLIPRLHFLHEPSFHHLSTGKKLLGHIADKEGREGRSERHSIIKEAAREIYCGQKTTRRGKIDAHSVLFIFPFLASKIILILSRKQTIGLLSFPFLNS